MNLNISALQQALGNFINSFGQPKKLVSPIPESQLGNSPGSYQVQRDPTLKVIQPTALIQAQTQSKSSPWPNSTPQPSPWPTTKPTPMPTPMPTPAPTPTPTPASVTVNQIANGQKTRYGRNPNASNPSEIVVDAITKAANKFGVPKELLFDMAFAESSFNPGSKNTTPEGIAADVPEGLFQFRPGTWQEVQRYAQNPESGAYGVITQQSQRSDPYANAAAAAYLIKQGQLGKWDASQWNWGQYWPEAETSAAGYYNQTMSRKRK